MDEAGEVVYWIKGQEQLLDADNNPAKKHEEKPQSTIDDRHLDTNIVILDKTFEKVLLIQGDAHAKIWNLQAAVPEKNSHVGFLKEVQWVPLTTYVYIHENPKMGEQLTMLNKCGGSQHGGPERKHIHCHVKKFYDLGKVPKDEFIDPEDGICGYMGYAKEDPSHYTGSEYLYVGPGMDPLLMLACRSHMAVRSNKKPIRLMEDHMK